MKRDPSSGMLPAKLSKAQIPAVYAARIQGYDRWARRTEAVAQARCLALAAIRDGEDVLEVAVGTGLSFGRVLRQNRHGRTVGVDLTPAMLAVAQQKVVTACAQRGWLQIADAYALPFGDGRFDVLLNTYMLDLLPAADFPAVLGEFRRVLRPGGRLVLASMTLPQRWYQGVWEAVYRLGPTTMAGCRGVKLAQPVQAAGFRLAHREVISQMTFPSEIVLGVI